MSKKQSKTREQELKGTSVYREGLVCTKRKGETWKEADERNDYFKQQGIKEGEQNIKDRIGNILSDENVYSTDEDKIGKIWFIIEEQKIKGDEK